MARWGYIRNGGKPLELVNARLYVDDELKYSSVANGYDLKLSEDIRTIKGYKVRTVHALKLAIINPEVWEKYEEWLEEVIKDGTEPEVKEFQKREKEKAKNVIARHKEDEIPAFKTEGLKTDELKTVTVEIKDLDL